MKEAVAEQLNQLTFDPSGDHYGLSDNEGLALIRLASMDDAARLYA